MLEKLENLENWVKRKYFLLFDRFGEKEFTLEDADIYLKSSGESGNTKELLSILRKAGLLKVKKNTLDERKRIYQFVSFDNKKQINKEDLFKKLKVAADLIRGSVDYKVLLIFLFYKTISDKWNKEVKKIIEEWKKENKNYSKEKAYLIANKRYFILYDKENKKLYTWDETTKDKNEILKLANNLIKISEMNDRLSNLKKLVDSLLVNFISNEDNYLILEKIVSEFNKIDFSEFNFDILGDAYQWILYHFAPQKNKEGEVYTPKEVIKLIVKLLDMENNAEILDPASGSGTMLIESYNYIKKRNSDASVYLQGQEINEITAILSELNMLIHGIINYEIYVGNSLINPRFKKADYVIANPPWNLDGYDENSLKTLQEIYKYGFTPKQSADWAWVQLMLYYAKKKIGVILDSGALFRSGKEKSIRKGVIEDDLIECVILLPEKLFYNTQAPGVILILNKNKSSERKGKVMFINASEEFEKHPEVRKLNILSEKNISKIVDAYLDWKEVEGFSRIVDIEEIKKNDYNLNVSLYVFPVVEEEKIDLEKEFNELLKIEKEEKEVMEKVKSYVEGILKCEKEI